MLELKSNVNTARKESTKVYEDNWHLSWFFRFIFPRGPQSYTGPEFDLRVAAHRLMGKERFDNKKLEFLPSGLAAYRLQQDLQLFANTYEEAFSAEQKSGLAQVIALLSGYVAAQLPLEKSLEILSFMKADQAVHQARLLDIAYERKQQLLQLKPGEKLLLPHGMLSKRGLMRPW